MKRAVPVALLVIALAVRVAFFRQWVSNPFLEAPVLDARGYLQWAEEIAGGDLLWKDFRLHGPGYPYFLAIVLGLTGRDLAAATFANSLLGCAWILLLWHAVRRLLPAPTAEIAAVLAAVYWPFLHFEGHLLATTWFLALTVLAFWWTVRATGDAASRGAFLFAGLTLGLATVTRPNGAVVLPFVLALVLLPRAGAPVAAALRAGRAALVLGGFAVVVVPVLVHNASLGGGLALQDHTMFNVYLGNGPESPGYVHVRLGVEWDRLADAPRREAGLTAPAAKNAWFRDQVLEHARAHPGAFAALQARKVLLFWNEREIRTTLSPYFFDEFAPLQRVLPGFGTIGPLALVGVFLAWRVRPRPWPLYAFALPPAALVVLTVVGSRYRLPVVPFLIPFAAWTLVCAGRWAIRRQLVPLGLCAAAIAAAILVVHHDFPDLDRESFGGEYARLASVVQESGDPESAARWWERALAEDPDRQETYIGYAGLALSSGDIPLVERLTREGLARRPGDWLLLMMRGRALLLLGDPEGSLAALRPVLALRSGDVDLLAGIARAHGAAGRADSAAHWFQRALSAGPVRPDVAQGAAEAMTLAADAPGVSIERRQALRSEARLLREQLRARAGTPPPPVPPAPGDGRSP